MQQAINLPDIAKNYYSGLCSSDPSTMTSNNMGMGWGFPYKDWPQDLKDSYAYNPTNAKKLLADAGFPNGFTTNIQVDGSADLDLLQIVQSYFSAVGIKMTIQSMPQPDWNVLVLTNHKGGPLTQRSTGYLGMTFDIDRQMQRFVTGSNWGLMGSPTVDDLYAKSVAASSVTDYQAAFNAINKYVAEQNFMISLLTPTVYYFAQPWFKGFMAQDDSVYGGSGPRLMGFYCSRFWIDQKQKASMGH
jgi:peptide/nickel transport system substrate-binding protein